MKKILSILFFSILLCTNSHGNIINLKCVWNSGYIIPSEDLSSYKGKTNFYKIDLKQKKILDSPSGSFRNEETEFSRTSVYIDAKKISFSRNTGNDMRIHTHEIDRNTGVLSETHSVDTGQLKGMTSFKYLCEKVSLKKKF